MGNNQSWTQNEMTSCALLLKGLGYKVVCIGFEGVIIPDGIVKGIQKYNKAHRLLISEHLAEQITPMASQLIYSLVTRGVTVCIFTNRSSRCNGEVKNNSYVYQGKPLIENVLKNHFSNDIVEYINIYETKDIHTKACRLKNELQVSSKNILIIDKNIHVIRRLQQTKFGTLLVEDHKHGLYLL